MNNPITIIAWFLVALFITGWVATKLIRKCWEWKMRFTMWRLARSVKRLGNAELIEIAQKLSKAIKDELRSFDNE